MRLLQFRVAMGTLRHFCQLWHVIRRALEREISADSREAYGYADIPSPVISASFYLVRSVAAASRQTYCNCHRFQNSMSLDIRTHSENLQPWQSVKYFLTPQLPKYAQTLPILRILSFLSPSHILAAQLSPISFSPALSTRFTQVKLCDPLKAR